MYPKKLKVSKTSTTAEISASWFHENILWSPVPFFCLFWPLNCCFVWAVTGSAPGNTRKKKQRTNTPRERASLNCYTHLQGKMCRGRTVSSSRGGSGGRCLWPVPGSGVGGGRGLLERGMEMRSAEGGRHRAISLLPHLLLHLEEKQTNTGVSERKRGVILLDSQ